jgi:hypothetical protein
MGTCLVAASVFLGAGAVLVAIQLLLRWLFPRLNAERIVVVGLVVLLAPIGGSFALMPLGGSRTQAFVQHANELHLVGKPAGEARRLLGPPDEVVDRGRYVLWRYNAAPYCLLCDPARVFVGLTGAVESVSMP